jgi:hypothetical protein
MKWFDKDLKQLRFNLINYGIIPVYTKFPKDPVVKNNFFQIVQRVSIANRENINVNLTKKICCKKLKIYMRTIQNYIGN